MVKHEKKVRRVITHARTVVFRFTIEEISGFLAKLLYVLLRTFQRRPFGLAGIVPQVAVAFQSRHVRTMVAAETCDSTLCR